MYHFCRVMFSLNASPFLLNARFKLRKWMTNDKALKDLIEHDENHKPENASATTEEESFAKFTLGSEVSKNCPKVLGLLWYFENDVIHFSFQKIVAKAQ